MKDKSFVRGKEVILCTAYQFQRRSTREQTGEQSLLHVSHAAAPNKRASPPPALPRHNPILSAARNISRLPRAEDHNVSQPTCSYNLESFSKEFLDAYARPFQLRTGLPTTLGRTWLHLLSQTTRTINCQCGHKQVGCCMSGQPPQSRRSFGRASFVWISLKIRHQSMRLYPMCGATKNFLRFYI